MTQFNVLMKLKKLLVKSFHTVLTCFDGFPEDCFTSYIEQVIQYS